MKTVPTLSALLAVVSLAASPVSAAIESIKIVPTTKPQPSPVMLLDGVTEGTVIFAIEVSADGKLTDWMVLGSTHPSLVRPCAEILKDAEITPARLDGSPVAAQADVTVDYRAEGVVISGPAVLNLDRHMRRIFGYRIASQRRSSNELDRVLAPLSSVAPKYAKDAEKDGVRGKVQVHFYVDETGAVRMPAVEGEAHPYLSEMAIAAVREWRFSPPTSHGKPVLVAARQEFNFSK